MLLTMFLSDALRKTTVRIHSLSLEVLWLFVKQQISGRTRVCYYKKTGQFQSNIRTAIYHVLVIILWHHKIQLSSHTHNMMDECIRRIELIAFSTIETLGEMRQIEVTEKQSSEIFLFIFGETVGWKKFFQSSAIFICRIKKYIDMYLSEYPLYNYFTFVGMLICRNVDYTYISNLLD